MANVVVKEAVTYDVVVTLSVDEAARLMTLLGGVVVDEEENVSTNLYKQLHNALADRPHIPYNLVDYLKIVPIRIRRA